MDIRDRLRITSPWTVILFAGCALLTLVGYWREQGPTAVPVIRGTLPNLIAVPTLAFGLLMIGFPERQPFDSMLAARQERIFWMLLAVTTSATIGWEFAQLPGNLVFDPLDLAATGIGALGAIALFYCLQPLSFVKKT